MQFDFKKCQQRLADKQATEAVLALPAVVINGRVWRNAEQSTIHWEIKYLRLRNLLMHNPEKPNLVLIRSIS